MNWNRGSLKARGDRAGAGVHRTLHWPANWRATVAAAEGVLRLQFRSAVHRCRPWRDEMAQLLRGRAEGIFVAPFEQGEIGPELFEAACRMGLEGLVSKHRERVYRPGRCEHWLKVKNRGHPAYSRVTDQF